LIAAEAKIDRRSGKEVKIQPLDAVELVFRKVVFWVLYCALFTVHPSGRQMVSNHLGKPKASQQTLLAYSSMVISPSIVFFPG